MRITVIAFTGLALVLAACGSGTADAPKDIVGFCKDTKCPPDNNPCTTDCDEAKDKCVYTELAAGTPCDDGNACTTGETCGASGCKGTEVVCDDKEKCTTDSCDKTKGCQTVPDTGKACDDDDACTEGDKCSQDGKCKPGAAKDCEDNNVCTADACEAVKGCTHKPKDGACEDGDKCTLGDQCKDGKCDPGAPDKCDDKKPCTDDSCNPKAGCDHVNNTIGCDDDDACTEIDKCKDGECKPGSAKDCKDDGSPCTLETCDKVKGCVTNKAADGVKCDDNDKCTEGDACAAGACEPGSKKNCPDDGDVCTAEFCDPKIDCTWKPAPDGKICSDGTLCTDGDACKGGTCIPGAKLDCDDKKPCTDDSCDAKVGCKYAQNAEPCEDGNKCTVGDLCKLGACAAGTAKVCDDNNVCTVDSCDVINGNCTTVNGKDATACDDGNKCTEDDACKSGKCDGATKVLCKDDGNPCTAEACDAVKGCGSTPAPGACSDGDPCTTGDACKDGKCTPLVAKCDDGNPCTKDSCDAVKGCVVSNDDGALCDDGLLCTEGDACLGGKCAVSKPKNCGDGNTCTDDKCDAVAGCKNPVMLDGSACDDGNACSTGDLCKAGVCKSSGESLWLEKKGKALQDRLFGLTVGSDGTIVSVGSEYTGKSIQELKLIGQAPDKSVVFDVKPLKAGPQHVLNAIANAPNGAYIAVGAADPNSTNWAAPNTYAIQINSNGKADWEFNGTAGGTSSYFSALTVSPSGGIAIVGTTYDPGPKGYIGSMAPAGGATFSPGMINLVYTPPSGFSGQYFRTVTDAPAGGYWVGGMAVYSAAGSGGAARILRLQANGVVTFDKIFGKSGNGSWQNSYRLIADKDGVTSFGDSSNGPYGDEDIWIIRIDNNNNVVYETHLGGPGADSLRDAVAAPGGGFFVAGYSTQIGDTVKKAFLGRVTASGLLEWQRILGQPDSRWQGIALTPTGRIALAGYTSYQTVGDEDDLLATCDQFGNCGCAASGTCLTKKPADCDDANPCTLDWCEASACKHAIGNEGLTCGSNQLCSKGKCVP